MAITCMGMNNALISLFIISIPIILCDLFEILITSALYILRFANILILYKIHWLVNTNLSSVLRISNVSEIDCQNCRAYFAAWRFISDNLYFV